MGEKTKQCPFCAETIKVEAIVCRYCGREMENSAQIEKPKARKYSRSFSLLIMLLLISCCLFVWILGAPNEDDTSQTDNAATDIQTTDRPKATRTLAPTEAIRKTIENTISGNDVTVDAVDDIFFVTF